MKFTKLAMAIAYAIERMGGPVVSR